MNHWVLLVGLALFYSCEPFVNEFPDEISVAEMYESVAKTPVTATTTPQVITWNIRFGSARFPFYGDSCGDKVIAKKDVIKGNLENITAEINSLDPDIILLQEVDMSEFILYHNPR